MATKNYAKSRSQEIAESRVARMIAGLRWSTLNSQPVKKYKQIEGRMIPYMDIETEDLAETMKERRLEDYQLENIIASDGVWALKENQITMNTLTELSMIENAAQKEIDKIDAHEWAAKWLKQNQQQKPEETKKGE